MPETRLDVGIAVEGKSNLTGLFGRDAATVRDLERAVVSLRQQVAQGVGRGGGIAPPALAGVGRAQDQLAAAQRQAVQVAARAALPPGLPRAGPGASLVPRPEMGAGVFGAAASTAAAAMARQQASNLARQNEWTRGQDRLAALAGGQRGATSQGPQAAREMADAAAALERTLRQTTGTARDAATAEQARGKAVGGSSAASVAAAAALGAGVAAAAGGGGGRGFARTELRGVERAARRGEASVVAVPQSGDRATLDFGAGLSEAEIAASLQAQRKKARNARVAAESRAYALEQAGTLDKPTPVGSAARGSLVAQAQQRQEEAHLRIAAAGFAKGDILTRAEDNAYKTELTADATDRLKMTEQQRRDARIRTNRLQFTDKGTPREGVTQGLNEQGAGFVLSAQLAEERRAAALAMRTGTGRSAADQARSAAGGIGGTGNVLAAASLARAGLVEGTNAARAGTVDAQALARVAGGKEGQAELKTTAALRRQEATAMRSVRWNEAVAAQGKLGASLTYAAGAAKGLGDSARNAFLFRVAEAGLLVGAASPSTMATLTGSVEMLAAAMGKSLIPAVDSVSLKLQQFSRGYGDLSPGMQQGISNTFLGSTAVIGGLWGLARVIQGAKWLWGGASGLGGVRGGFLWAKDALGFGAQGVARGAGAFPASMGPGAVAAGPGVLATYAGISGTTVALAGLAAAALTAEYALLEYSVQQRRNAFARNEDIAKNLSRRDVLESEAYKRAAGAAPGEQAAVAGKEYDEALRQFNETSKRAAEQGMYPFRNFFEGVEQSIGGRTATVSKAEYERDAARKRLEIAKASYEEVVNKKPFEGGPGSPDQQRNDKLLRSLRGLPQPFMTDSAVEYANRIQLAALRPEGELDKQNWANQLKILAETKQLLADIKANTSPTVPRAANVNDRP